MTECDSVLSDFAVFDVKRAVSPSSLPTVCVGDVLGLTPQVEGVTGASNWGIWKSEPKEMFRTDDQAWFFCTSTLALTFVQNVLKLATKIPLEVNVRLDLHTLPVEKFKAFYKELFYRINCPLLGQKDMTF